MRRAASLLPFAGLLAVGVGCNSILGIDEASPVDGGIGGGAGTGASGGTAGSSAGGYGGTATGGSAGAAGSAAGAAGSAGSCGDTTSDTKNCGACGHDCLGGDCQGGVCQPFLLASAGHGMQKVALSDDAAFVTGRAEFFKVLKSNGDKTSWTDPNGSDMDPLAIVDDHVYFAEVDEQIWSAPIADATPAPTAIITNSSSLGGLWADADGLYYADCGTNNIMKAAHDGTGPTAVVTGLNFCATQIRSDDQNLYFTDATYGSVYSGPKSGGTATTISTLGPLTLALEYDGTDRVYFSTFDDYALDSTIHSVKTDGTDQMPHYSEAGVGAINSMALDGNMLYFVVVGHYDNDFADGSLRRIDISDSTATDEVLATDQGRPLGVAVDSEAVYWTCGGAMPDLPSRLYRLAK